MNIGNRVISFPYIMAPMAGYTDLPFRLLIRNLGCELAYTEMVSSEGLVREVPASRSFIKTVPEDHPLTVQLFGADPEIMARAALMAQAAGADIIDINMGCPVKKVVKTGAGAALLKSLRQVETLIKAVRRSIALPLTIKIRPGWSKENPVFETVARIAEESGVDAVIIHPRWAVQGFSGQADWSILREVKEKIKIPVIGNGDVQSASQAIALKKSSGADGIMIGRQALTTPWIFTEIRALEAGGLPGGPTLKQRRLWLTSYWDWIMANQYGRTQIQGLRRALFILTRGLPDSGGFRQKVALAKSPENLKNLFENYMRSLLPQAQAEGQGERGNRFS